MGESPDTEYTDIQKAIIMRHHLVQQKKEMLPVNWCPDDDPPDERPMSLQRVTDLTPFVRSMQDWLAAHDREVAAKAEEWGHDLEAVLVETYTILKPLGEGTHAPDSPILKALAVLGEQDFTGKRLERDREVAAKALEDAVGDWSALVIEGKPPMREAPWLTHRAARIREGQD